MNGNMEDHSTSANPRLGILRREVEQTVLKPFRSHGWSADIVREIDRHDCIEVAAERGAVVSRIAVLYSSSGISNASYRELSDRVDRIFFNGQPYMLDSFAKGVSVPVEPLGDFFLFLVDLNKQVEPDRSPRTMSRRTTTVRRLTAENPLEAVLARLRQFTSEKLAAKLVGRRAEMEDIILPPEAIATKATGIAYSMRGALDYMVSTPRDALNRRVLGLYYGMMALAQAEMLASPSGPIDLDQIEGMTRHGHGLYAMSVRDSGFGDVHVGVLASGFLPQWMNLLGHDTSVYPRRRPRSAGDLEAVPTGMVCALRDLFASMPEIDDLLAEVFGGPPGWVAVAYDQEANARRPVLNATARKANSTYGLFLDRSGKVSVESLRSAGWPLAEIRQEHDDEGRGTVFRARVDHAGHDLWWTVLPTYSSPFGNSPALLFPTVGGLREYRTIAAVTLYALSIMARYMPSAWRRIEGGDEDQYLALVQASLGVWERLLPEHFLQSIAGETVRTVQPGSWLA